MSGYTLVIGAGTNLGGRRSILRAARDLVAYRFGVADLRVAPVWETAPMGPPQPDYLNTAFALDFRGALPDALDRCLDIERALGRERRERWGPRTLDLDLLWHASMSCDGGGLTVPHQGLRERTFALDPLLALVPDAVDPRDGTALAEVRRALAAAGPSTLLGDGFEARPDDRADALAAVAEEIGAKNDGSRSVSPATAVKLELPWADGVRDDERLRAWIASVTELLDARRFVLRRAAVIEDSERLTRGIFFGEERAPIGGARTSVTRRR
jgi:2-amino-4-hydroxy-6-hydroxymethyldihydropteridine diphosphokinase